METYKTTQEQKLENARKHVKESKVLHARFGFRIGKRIYYFL